MHGYLALGTKMGADMGQISTTAKSLFFYRWHGLIDSWYLACRTKKGLAPPESEPDASQIESMFTMHHSNDDEVLTTLANDPTCRAAEEVVSMTLRLRSK